MTNEEVQADVVRRIRGLLALAEAGQLTGIAYAFTSAPGGATWGHSAYGAGAGPLLIAALEAVKLDLVRHVMPCACVAAEGEPYRAVGTVNSISNVGVCGKGAGAGE